MGERKAPGRRRAYGAAPRIRRPRAAERAPYRRHLLPGDPLRPHSGPGNDRGRRRAQPPATAGHGGRAPYAGEARRPAARPPRTPVPRPPGPGGQPPPPPRRRPGEEPAPPRRRSPPPSPGGPG